MTVYDTGSRKRKTVLQPVDRYSSSKHVQLNSTASDECVLDMTFDKDVGVSENHTSKRCEF